MCDICGCERLREGGTDPGFLFLSDQFHSPQLTIVKLTMKTTIPTVSIMAISLLQLTRCCCVWIGPYLFHYCETETSLTSGCLGLSSNCLHHFSLFVFKASKTTCKYFLWLYQARKLNITWLQHKGFSPINYFDFMLVIWEDFQLFPCCILRSRLFCVLCFECLV